MPPARRGDAFEIRDGAREARIVRVVEVDLIPSHAIPMDTAGQRVAKVADGKSLDKRRGANVEFGDDPVVVLALGAEFLKASDHTAILRPNLSSEHQLETDFISFRHAALPESSR
jgi:hypothetical protein